MAVTFTYDATNLYILVSGNNGDYTIVSQNAIEKRLYFAAGTFTEDEHNDRPISQYEIYLKIKKTGTNYLEFNFWPTGGFPSSSVRIGTSFEEIRLSDANMLNGEPITVLYTDSYGVKTYQQKNIQIRIAIDTNVGVFHNVIGYYDSNFTATTNRRMFYFSSYRNALSFGEGSGTTKEFFNNTLNILLLQDGSLDPFQFYAIYTTNAYYKVALFNCELYLNYNNQASLSTSYSTTSLVLLYNRITSDREDNALTTFSGNAGIFKNNTFINTGLWFSYSTGEDLEIEDLKIIYTKPNIYSLFRNASSGITVNLSNVEILASNPENYVGAILFETTGYFNVFNIKLPFDLSIDYFRIGNDYAYVQIFSKFDIHLKDINGDFLQGATIDFICLDDETLNITGLTTDEFGTITTQNLLAYKAIKVDLANTLLTYNNWKLIISKTGYKQFVDIFENKGQGFERIITLSNLDELAPLWTNPAEVGILSVTRSKTVSQKVSIIAGQAYEDESNPISYNLYMKEGDDENLFLPVNFQLESSVRTFDFTYDFKHNTIYYFGVRATDAVGNETDNTNSLTMVYSDALELVEDFSVLADYTVSDSNKIKFLDPYFALETTEYRMTDFWPKKDYVIALNHLDDLTDSSGNSNSINISDVSGNTTEFTTFSKQGQFSLKINNNNSTDGNTGLGTAVYLNSSVIQSKESFHIGFWCNLEKAGNFGAGIQFLLQLFRQTTGNNGFFLTVGLNDSILRFRTYKNGITVDDVSSSFTFQLNTWYRFDLQKEKIDENFCNYRLFVNSISIFELLTKENIDFNIASVSSLILNFFSPISINSANNCSGWLDEVVVFQNNYLTLEEIQFIYNLQQNKYFTDKPTLTSNNDLTATKIEEWVSHNHTLIGDGSIGFRFSIDSGVTWLYYNTTAESWVEATEATHYNTLAEVQSYMKYLDTSTNTIKHQRFFISDGSQAIELRNALTFYGISPSPIIAIGTDKESRRNQVDFKPFSDTEITLTEGNITEAYYRVGDGDYIPIYQYNYLTYQSAIQNRIVLLDYAVDTELVLTLKVISDAKKESTASMTTTIIATLPQWVEPTEEGILAVDTLEDSKGKVIIKCGKAYDTLNYPIKYKLYMQHTTDTDLFLETNFVKESDERVFEFKYDFDSTKTYYFGVKATDLKNNLSVNTNYLSKTGLTTSNINRVINNIKNMILSRLGL